MWKWRAWFLINLSTRNRCLSCAANDHLVYRDKNQFISKRRRTYNAEQVKRYCKDIQCYLKPIACAGRDIIATVLLYFVEGR